MTDRHEWPQELWIARVTDCPSWFVSVCDTPRQPTDRRYVLADWIFVDNRLPEPFQTVIVLGPRGEQSTAHWHPELETWYVDALHGFGTVIAWQPLPPPPTAEQIASYRTRTEGAPCYDD